MVPWGMLYGWVNGGCFGGGRGNREERRLGGNRFEA